MDDFSTSSEQYQTHLYRARALVVCPASIRFNSDSEQHVVLAFIYALQLTLAALFALFTYSRFNSVAIFTRSVRTSTISVCFLLINSSPLFSSRRLAGSIEHHVALLLPRDLRARPGGLCAVCGICCAAARLTERKSGGQVPLHAANAHRDRSIFAALLCPVSPVHAPLI
eukprot:m.179766 g.179766  ORF g.179766 m.179766 type:complete len:170 (-) comp53425_c0_seq23:1828-2337(-)